MSCAGVEQRKKRKGGAVPGGDSSEEVGRVADLFCGAHGVEHLGHDFAGADATDVVYGLQFQQFGAGQDDAQLVVQAMEQGREGPFRLERRVRGQRGLPELVHACEPVGRTVAFT